MANKLPAYFQVCLQCRGTNPNPNYQYCPTCFRVRNEDCYKFYTLIKKKKLQLKL